MDNFQKEKCKPSRKYRSSKSHPVLFTLVIVVMQQAHYHSFKAAEGSGRSVIP
jgi:hypothetical protein